MKITDYAKQTSLVDNNVFLIDGDNGTKTILAHDLANALLSLLTSNEQIANFNMDDLNQTTSLLKTDKILVGTSDGTKAISANDALFGILDSCISVEERRNIFRGKNLGTAFTSAQKNEIKEGTFKGFFLGDYWEIGGKIWRIVDFNYWLNTGDNPNCTTSHLVIMPDSTLYEAKMNDTNITTGGYMGSKMYTTNLNNAKTLINSAFGSANILNHREFLTNAVTNGYPTGGVWVDSTIELPNEIMMYGSYIFSPSGNGSIVPFIHTIDKTQLSLMKHYPKFINPKRQNQWLRDVVAATHFAHVFYCGHTGAYDASNSRGVRPVFGVIG